MSVVRLTWILACSALGAATGACGGDGGATTADEGHLEEQGGDDCTAVGEIHSCFADDGEVDQCLGDVEQVEQAQKCCDADSDNNDCEHVPESCEMLLASIDS